MAGEIDISTLATSVLTCPDIATLKKLNGMYDKQRVYVTHYGDGFVSGGGDFYYDAKDTTTADNGITVIKAADGKCWKREVQGEINLYWAGISETQDNASAFQKTVNLVRDMAVANKSASGIPRITIPAGKKIILNSQIDAAPYIKLDALGPVWLDFSRCASGEGKMGFRVHNTSKFDDDIGKMFANQSSFLDGPIFIQGPGKSKVKSNSDFAIDFGNNEEGHSPSRNARIDGVSISGFGSAFNFRGISTYLTNIRDSRFESNLINIRIAPPDNKDSGERISFDNCVFAGSGVHPASANSPSDEANIYVDAPGFDVNFINCSFDYSYGDVMKMGPNYGYSKLDFTNCHFEEWDGYLVNAPKSKGNAAIYISFSIILPLSSFPKEVPNSPSRPLFNIGTGVVIDLADFEIRHQVHAYNDEMRMVTPESTGSLRVEDYVKDPFPHILTIVNNDYKFDNDELDFHFEKNKATTWWSCIDAGNTAAKVVKVTIPGNSNTQAIELTSTAASSVYIRFRSNEKFPVRPGERISAFIALQALKSTGNLHCSWQFYFFDYEGKLLSGAAGTSQKKEYNFRDIFNNTAMPNYSQENGGNRSIAHTYSGFVVPAGASGAVLEILVSDFQGTVNLTRAGAYYES